MFQTGHTKDVDALTVLQNGNLVSGSEDNSIKIWNQTSGTLIQTLGGPTLVTRNTFTKKNLHFRNK